MGYGVLQQGQNAKGQSLDIMRTLMNQERQKRMQKESIENAEDANQKQMIGTGAGMGVQYDYNNNFGATEANPEMTTAEPGAHGGYAQSPVSSEATANGVQSAPIEHSAVPQYDVAAGAESSSGVATETATAEVGTEMAATEVTSGVGAEAVGAGATEAVGAGATEAAATVAAESAATTAATTAATGATTAVSGAAGAAGAAEGASTGAAMGPWGMVIGAAAGYLISEIL